MCWKAVKIALELKKHLVDNDFMDISQVRAAACKQVRALVTAGAMCFSYVKCWPHKCQWLHSSVDVGAF